MSRSAISPSVNAPAGARPTDGPMPRSSHSIGANADRDDARDLGDLAHDARHVVTVHASGQCTTRRSRIARPAGSIGAGDGKLAATMS